MIPASLFTHVVELSPLDLRASTAPRLPRHAVGLDCQCTDCMSGPWPTRPRYTPEQRRAMAAEAGARGVSAEPMTVSRRMAAYERQNGYIADPDTDGPRGRRMTARQWRQTERMHYRATA